MDESPHFLEVPHSLLLHHSVVSVSHYRDQQVQEHERHHQDSQQEHNHLQSRVLLKGEVPEVQKIDMQQEARVGALLESIIWSGGGEEERDSKSGGHHEEHERNHVLDDFDDNAEEDASALEEREDLEGLHALEQAQKSQERALRAVLGRGGASPTDRHSEVDEGEDETENVEVVPEVAKVSAAFVLHFNGLDGQAPDLDGEKREDEEGRAEEGGVEEEQEQPSQEQGVVKDEEAERIVPPLLEVDLDELGLEDGEVPSVGEVPTESECEGMIAWRKPKRASVDLDLSPLILASPS